MNQKVLFYIGIISLLSIFFACRHSNYTNIEQELRANWQFKQSDLHDWHTADVPGCVHSDLQKHQLIPDYLTDDNEQKVQWASQKNWDYKTHFSLDDKILSKKHIDLIFKGLDTYSEVFLNDSLVLTSDNMFREYKVDCKALLKKENSLLIKFKSPITEAEKASKKYAYEFDGGTKVFSRKAGFQYGWDWGPKITTCGIWRPIVIRAYDLVEVTDIQLINKSITQKEAIICANITLNSLAETKGKISISNENKSLIAKDISLKKGLNKCTLRFKIENPVLWQTNGLGKPFLYDFTIDLKLGNAIAESKTQRHGIRTIELLTEPDKKGESFYFKLNGKPLFMKGANYIPQDNILTRVNKEDYKNIIAEARKMNINMLRVWGGGIYENDIFYELCDENGILVWQDFMFACAMYPGDSAFIKNVETEARQNIKRLRNHPCLALWCGNNEVDEAWHNWGWANKYNKQDSAKVRQGYENIFMKLLPDLVSDLDSGKAYRHSSPTFGRGNKNYKHRGDAHDWYVWHDAKPFEHFEKNVPRFMSEFGFQSLPAMHSIKKFVTKGAINLKNASLKNHQKHPRGNQLIKQYMQNDYFIPEKFEHFVYLSQLMQAEGIAKAIEAHRRSWRTNEESPHCGGSLFWQLNDCWPAVSWSAIDYYKNKKALYYFSKKAFEKLLISGEITQNELKVFVVSDSLIDFDAHLQIQTKDFKGNIIFSEEKPVQIKANTSKIYANIALHTLFKNNSAENIFCEIKLLKGKEILGSKIIYFCKTGDLQLSPAKPKIVTTQKSDKERIIQISSDVLLKNIYLDAGADAEFSDNFFDVLPGVNYTVKLKFRSNAKNPGEKIRAFSFADIKN